MAYGMVLMLDIHNSPF